MRQFMKGAGIISAGTLMMGLAMCFGGGIPVTGWLLAYMTALAFVSLCGFGAWIHE